MMLLRRVASLASNAPLLRPCSPFVMLNREIQSQSLLFLITSSSERTGSDIIFHHRLMDW
jgi:hypothetical protein